MSPAATGSAGPRPSLARASTDRPRSGAGLVELAALGLLCGLVALMVWQASRPLTNGDTFFHLRFGQEFLSGRWSISDPGSVTAFGTADWLPTQWLPQLIIAQLESWWGLPAVAWFSGLQYVVLVTAVWAAARSAADPLVASTVAVVVLIACSPGLSMRPQVMSYALVAIFTTCWLRARRSGAVPWWLVPLCWFWAMYHGMWPIGILIGAVAVVGMAMDRGPDRAPLHRLAAVPLLGAFAALMTPTGPRLFSSVLQVSSRAEYFSEWAPPSFTTYYGAAALGLVAVPVLLHIRGGTASWSTVLLVGLTTCCLVYSMRTVPVAAAMIAPFTAEVLQREIRPRARVTVGERRVVGLAAVSALAVLAALVPQTASRPGGTPAWLAPEMAALPSGTVVVNNTSFGGYLMWAFPALDVMISGYGDVYTDAEMRRNARIQALEPGWDDDLRLAGAEVAVVDPDRPLGYGLELAGWRVVRRAESVELLVAPPGW